MTPAAFWEVLGPGSGVDSSDGNPSVPIGVEADTDSGSGRFLFDTRTILLLDSILQQFETVESPG